MGKANKMRKTIFSIIFLGIGVFAYSAFDHSKEEIKPKTTKHANPIIADIRCLPWQPILIEEERADIEITDIHRLPWQKSPLKEESAEPVIAETCKWLNSIDWEDGEPPADTFWYDGYMCFGSMPVRGAERTFDTVINHSHVYFMTK